MIEAVCFDLDDTLFLQEHWLAGAWRTVAEVAHRDLGLDPVPFVEALERVASEGTASGGIIDRALAEVGASGMDTGPLIGAFRSHRAGRLEPLAGVVAGLARLRERLPLALVTDGDVDIQQGKITDLGLDEAFDVVVLSDRRGRDHRKPHPAPFLDALAGLDRPAAGVVHVGDNPVKDVRGAMAVGLRAIRVRTGEYAMVEGDRPWADVADVAEALDLIDAHLARPGGVTIPAS